MRTPLLPTAFNERRSERGSVLTLMALFLAVILGFGGLAVDSARLYTFDKQIEAAADAAALAGIARLPADVGPDYLLTRMAARDFAAKNAVAGTALTLELNLGNAGDGDIVVGRWDAASRTLIPDTAAPNAVQVNARRTSESADGDVETVFGRLFGVTRAAVAHTAVAHQKSGDALLLVLDPSLDKALDFNGNPTVDASAGTIQVNSSDSCAFHYNGDGTLLAGAIDVTGKACVSGKNDITGPINENQPPLPDPLAGLLPTTGDWNALKNSMPKPKGNNGQIRKGGTYVPGHYPMGMKLSGKAKVTLLPGTYLFGGKGIQVSGQAEVSGDGVALLIDRDADLHLNGGDRFVISAPESGEFGGVALFHHRQNTGDSQWLNNGNAEVIIDGTTYVPGGEFRINGNPETELGMLICDRAKFNGNPTLTFSGEGKSSSKGPSLVY